MENTMFVMWKREKKKKCMKFSSMSMFWLS